MRSIRRTEAAPTFFACRDPRIQKLRRANIQQGDASPDLGFPHALKHPRENANIVPFHQHGRIDGQPVMLRPR